MSNAKSFQEIIASETPVLIDFHATWCGPCKTMAPILDQVKRELGDSVTIIKVDVDRNQQLASQLNISGVPTLILYKSGKQCYRKSGVIPAQEITSVIQQYQ